MVYSNVRQKEARGCGIAVLAIVTGKTYDEIAAYFGGEFESQGLYLHDLDVFLSNNGFAYARRFRIGGFRRRTEQTPWPVPPFAPVHIVEVRYASAPVNHFVVMRRDGTVLDPLQDAERSITDYTEILNITGIWQMVELDRTDH